MIYTDKYVVFDLETTGLSSRTDDIVEIGAIKVLGNTQKRFKSYVKPSKPISPMARKVNGITDDMLANAPTIDTVIVKFLDFIGDLPLIAHNSSFDIAFVRREALKYCGKTIENPVVDTVRLAKKYYPDLPNYKLCTIKDYFKVPVQSLHNTIDDCIVALYFYQRLMNDVPEFQNELYSKTTPNQTPKEDTPQELSREELKFFDKVKSILQNAHVNTNTLKAFRTRQYLDIMSCDRVFYRFKLNGNLKYWLLDIPYKEFQNRVRTDYTYTRAIFNEGDKTRLFIEDYTDLDVFSNIIIDEFNKANNKLP